MSAINIQSIVKRFGGEKGGTYALNDVSFEIPRGGVFGLLGPNGAGKTTLFSLIAGFLKPTKGSIKCLDIDVEEISKLRGRLTILPQDAQFASNVPIVEQIIFFAMLNGRNRKEAEEDAARALQIVGLLEVARKGARVLSHGMAKRLGIAQAFLGDPEVILLDEPTAGLDPASAQGVRDLIEHLRTTSTLIVSSHDLGEIQRMCDSVAILDKGKLVKLDSVKKITQADNIQRMTFARALTDAEVAAIKSTGGVTGVDAEGQLGGAQPGFGYRVHYDAAQRPIDQITAEMVQKLVATGAIPRSIEDGVNLESKFLEVTTAPMGQS